MPATKAQKERVIALLNAISDLDRGDLLAVLGFPLDDADGPEEPVQLRMGGEFAYHLEKQLGQLISFGEKLTTTKYMSSPQDRTRPHVRAISARRLEAVTKA